MMIAVFRSRAHSLHYLERMRQYGIYAAIMSTPKDVKIGCGICVRFDERDVVRAYAVLKTGRYASFKGVYKIDYTTSGTRVTPYQISSYKPK